MHLKEAENIFNRALRHSLSRKKILCAFLPLVLCGLLVVLCRAFSVQASNWVVFSLTFLPIFLCFGLLMALGSFLIKIYRDELSGVDFNLSMTLKNSWSLMVGVSYLAMPMVLVYVVLWTLLGIFYLFRHLPAVGEAFSIVFSFGPFLLVLGCLLLCIANFFLLFFLTPHVALKKKLRLNLVVEAYQLVKENLLTHIILFLIAALPLLFIVGILSLAAALTGATFIHSKAHVSIALEWFFIMIPFVALLTPAVIFFFNFAAESAFLVERRAKESL